MRRAALRLIAIMALMYIPLLISCGDDDDNDNEASADDDANGDIDDDLNDDTDDDTNDDADDNMNDEVNDDIDDDANDDVNDDIDDDQQECDEALGPVVFLHGFLENGDAFDAQTQRFSSNGYCIGRVYSYDWNTLDDYAGELSRLRLYIDSILADSGAEQVDLVGHSMGGSLGYDYLSVEADAAKVAHFALVGSYPQDAVPFGVPTINICSPFDTAAGCRDLPDGESFPLEGLDHLQIATFAEPFELMYRFFNDGQDPQFTEAVTQDNVRLSGRALVIAFNDPMPELGIDIYEFDPTTGERLSETPDDVFTTDEDGNWGVFHARPGAYYEFVCLDPSGIWPPIHYYREPFVHSTDKVHFRVFPAWPAAALVYRLFLAGDSHSLFAWLGLNQAVVHGRDTFTLDGIDLATPEMADPENTTIAVMFFDSDFDRISDLVVPGGIYSSFLFIRVFDMYVGTAPRRPIEFIFNGRPMSIPNIKSQSEGLAIAVFN